MESSRPLTPERGAGKMRKKLPIGIDGFEKSRKNDFYYVDKTLFIKELTSIVLVHRKTTADELLHL